MTALDPQQNALVWDPSSPEASALRNSVVLPWWNCSIFSLLCPEPWAYLITIRICFTHYICSPVAVLKLPWMTSLDDSKA